MAVTVHPTLDVMSTIYRLPTEGGPDSVRFRSYVELAGSGHRIHEYNPMTSNPAALETIEMLQSLDAERLVADTLGTIDDLDDLEIAVAVLTPGAWTDRLFTELRNRLGQAGSIWFWSGEPLTRESVAATARAEAARILWRRAQGPPETLRQFASQEAVSLNAAGFEPADADDAVTEILDILGDEADDATLIAFMAGDERAEAGEWSSVGITSDEGPRTVARWLQEETTWPAAIESGWSPTR